jgi:CRISPR-associated protein Cas2
MTVIVLERVPASLRGELSRWLLEPHPRVFVGKPSALVRNKLWELIADKLKGGAALMVYSSATEQGYTMVTSGNTARQLRDFEELFLVVA